MTTAVAARTETGTAIAASGGQPAPLPSVLTKQVLIEGFREGQWLPVLVEGDDKLKCERSLLEIEQRLTPANDQQILAMLTGLAEYYGLKQDEDGLTTRLAMMVEDLRGFSIEHIAAAIKDHRQGPTPGCNFFPRGELRGLCVRRRAYALVMRRRARISLGMDEASEWEKDLLVRNADQEARKLAFAQGPSRDLESKLDGLPLNIARPLRAILKAPHDEAAKHLEHEQQQRAG